MKALVTGAGGFIGGHLVRYLLGRGDEVSCLVRPEGTADGAQQPCLRRVRASYFDAASLRHAVAGMDVVFHAGALLSARNWQEYRKANVEGTANLMEACARGTSGLRRFVLLSSIAAAGPAPQGRPLNEADACRPVSPYGRSKLLAEEAASGFMARMPLVVIRPPNVLGVGQRELSSVLRLLNRGIVPLVGSRRPQTSILFVEDLVRALALVADRDAANGKTYYVAADEPRSWRGILDALLAELAPGLLLKIPHPLLMGVALVAEAAARLTGGTPLLTRSDLRSARDNLWLCDAGLIRRELGFAATVEFSQGIRDIVRRFDRRHGTWQDSGDG